MATLNETVEEDLVVTQGDDWSRTLELELSQGSLAGDPPPSIVMTILHPETSAQLLQLTSAPAGGIEIVDGTHIRVTITNAQSGTLLAERRHRYDVEVTLPSGSVKTPVKGNLWAGWQATP